MSAIETLFEPFSDGTLDVANRVVMAPMTRSRSPGGVPTADVAAYYERRAESGVGLIVTEGVAIDRPGALDDPDVPAMWGRSALGGWREVVSRVHAAGGRIMPQLWHVGAYAGRRSRWLADDPRVESPSGLKGPGDPLGRVMGDADIADTLAAYADAARVARAIGFDGVEIHGAHGYLIDQFLWSGTNRRDDRYGGDTLAARSRFAEEVVRAVREAVGPDFPVSFRFSQFKQQDYDARLADDPAELATMLEPLADAGVTIFHASQRRFWEPAFEGSALNLAGWAKRLTGRTAITVGSVGLSGEYLSNREGQVSAPTSLDELLERLDRGEFDLIAVGRALLNDHLWLNKVRDGDMAGLRPFDLAALDVLY